MSEQAARFAQIGKLFKRERTSNYVASTWVIGDRAFFTADHCLSDDNGTVFDDVVFHPQYRNGSSTGAFAVVQRSVDERYTNFGDDAIAAKIEYDMLKIVLRSAQKIQTWPVFGQA